MKASRSTVYTAYGLTIQSELPLPELPLQEGSPDVRVSLGTVDWSCLEDVGERQKFWADADEARYAYDAAGAFSVRNGHDIVVDTAPHADPRTVRLCLLGPVLGLILHQRGRFVLHGSAVAIGDAAVAFLGGNGWGKSTLAAACHSHGHEMITDDVLAVDLDCQRPFVLPSYPQFKLWPKSAVALGAVPEELPIVHPEFDKRWRAVTAGFSRSAVPLKRCYLLGRGPELCIEPLDPGRALLALLNCWYGRRFGSPLLQAIDQRSHFLHSAALAKNIRVSRLLRPADLSSLPDQVGLLERDVQSD